MDKLAPRDEWKLKRFALEALRYVKDKVAYADALIENVSKVEAKLLANGDESMMPYSSKAAMQLRLVKSDGKHVEVSLGMETLEQMRDSIDSALAMLEIQNPDPEYGLAPIPNPKKVRYGKVLQSDVRTDEDITLRMSYMIDEIEDMAEEMGEASGVELNPEVSIFTQVHEKIIADSEGVYKTQILPSSYLQLFVRARKGSKLAQYRIRIADIDELDMFFAGNVLNPEIRSEIENAMRIAMRLLYARKLAKEELKKLTHYVLLPTALVFVHEAVGHNFEADIVKTGGSGIIKPDGEPVAKEIGAKIVDLYDGPPLIGQRFDYTKGFGTELIDDEGVEVKPVQLVRRGRIVGKMNNRQTAFHYKEKPNGHGFSELGQGRLVRMTNTYIAPPKGVKPVKFNELIRDINFGVMLENSLGGEVNKDGMSTNIQVGYLIKDGKLTGTVLLPINMAVATRTALLNIEAYSGNVQIISAGFCGKGTQLKFSTEGGPIMRLRASKGITLAS